MKTKQIILAFLLGVIFISACQHKEEVAPDSEKYFPRVKTIIANNCLSCHSAVAGTWEGRPVALDTDEEIVTANAIIKSTVADSVFPGNFAVKRMPKGGQLPSEDISVIVTWLEKGGRSTD
ncbi:MAG: hypothetical protein JNM22_15565 [Saprospiraceae bacterium]|nr:hypothetical protein [Saprospiraceae bacterium]